MVETHVFNATLLPALRESGVFKVQTFLNGLVAPSFLFASGLVFAVTTRRKLHEYLSFRWPLFRQISRLLIVALLGYLLHLPKFNYYHLRYEAGDPAWRTFFQVDVLQCIAVSLLLMQALLFFTKTERRLYTVITGLAMGIVFIAPAIGDIDFAQWLPFALAAYVNGLHGSLFPLFPWSAFVFAGAILGYRYLRARDADRENPAGDATGDMMQWTAMAAVGLLIASFALHPFASLLYPQYDYWRSSPSFFLLRVALVILLCAGLFLFERRRGVSRSSVVTLMGRESLLVYAAHLMAIYGKLGGSTFADRVGETFGVWEAWLTTLVLLGLMFLLALAWDRVRKGPPLLKPAVQGVLLLGFLLFFFYGPR
jgi:hypothetical protein